MKKSSKFKKNYFNIFDKNGYILFSILAFGVLLIMYSIFYSYQPSHIKQIFLSPSLWYQNNGHLWSDPLFDIYVPFIGAILLCISFFKDYSHNIYEIMTFYNREKFNSLVFFKWMLYTSTLVIINVLSSIIYYRYVILNFNSIFVLLLRFAPPVLFMNSLALIILVFCKNIYVSISILSIYMTVDLLSSGRYPKIFTLYCNSFYLKNLQYFYFNRLLLFLLSIIFVLLACKRATKL